MIGINFINKKTFLDKNSIVLLRTQALAAIEYNEKRKITKEDVINVNNDLRELKRTFYDIKNKNQHKEALSNFKKNKCSIYKAVKFSAMNDCKSDYLILSFLEKNLKNKTTLKFISEIMIANLNQRKEYLNKSFGIISEINDASTQLSKIYHFNQGFKADKIFNLIYKKANFNYEEVPMIDLLEDFKNSLNQKADFAKKVEKFIEVIENNNFIEFTPKLQMIKADCIDSLKMREHKPELLKNINAIYNDFVLKGKCLDINNKVTLSDMLDENVNIKTKPKAEVKAEVKQEEKKPLISVRRKRTLNFK